VRADTSLRGTITIDSVLMKWDDAAHDDIDDNENILSLSHTLLHPDGSIHSTAVSDLDGDGVAVGQNPYNQTARLVTSTTKGTIEETMVLDAHCGADANFDNESDNKILALEWVRTDAGDTVAYARFGDADADGYLVDHAAARASVVDVEVFEKNPATAPLVASSSLALRVEVGADGTERITKLSGSEIRKAGRLSTIVLQDSPDGSGDEVLDPGEKAHVTFATHSSPADAPVASAQATVVFDPVSGLQNPEDNLYYEIHATEQRRVGAIASQTFRFTTTQPVAAHQQPLSGHLELSVTYRNGDTVSMTADFAEGMLRGTYTDPDGQTSTVSWNQEGTVVSTSTDS
jgi:hypothetical protein